MRAKREDDGYRISFDDYLRNKKKSKKVKCIALTFQKKLKVR
jgi:hypothetical protein